MPTTDRVTDARIRRAASRLNLKVCKSRWHVGSIDNRGYYQIVDPNRNSVLAGVRYEMNAVDVAKYLADEATAQGYLPWPRR